MTSDTTHGNPTCLWRIAVTSEAIIDVGNKQVGTFTRLISGMALQTCRVASVFFHDLVRKMIEASCREEILRQPYRVHLVARIYLTVLMLFNDVAANAAPNCKLFTNVGCRCFGGTIECRIDAFTR